MCGFLVVGSEEFELQVFQKALDKAAYRGPDINMSQLIME